MLVIRKDLRLFPHEVRLEVLTVPSTLLVPLPSQLLVSIQDRLLAIFRNLHDLCHIMRRFRASLDLFLDELALHIVPGSVAVVLRSWALDNVLDLHEVLLHFGFLVIGVSVRVV